MELGVGLQLGLGGVLQPEKENDERLIDN